MSITEDLPFPGSTVVLREAVGGDLPAIVELLVDDQLGAEAVRVRQDYRSRGLGAAMFQWAISESRRRGCALVQLTTDRSRADAHRFCERLGFIASHEGFKLAF